MEQESTLENAKELQEQLQERFARLRRISFYFEKNPKPEQASLNKQYVESFNATFPATEQEQELFADDIDRIKGLYNLVHTWIYREIDSREMNLEELIGYLCNATYVKRVEDNAYNMTHYLFPKIGSDFRNVFLEQLRPKGYNPFAAAIYNDFSPTAAKMVISIAIQNSDDIKFLMQIYEEIKNQIQKFEKADGYYGGPMIPMLENLEDILINSLYKTDEQGRVIQEVSGCKKNKRPKFEELEILQYEYPNDKKKTNKIKFIDFINSQINTQ